MISDKSPILDWHLNTRWPEHKIISALGPIPGWITSASNDPIWLQIKENSGAWEPEPPGEWSLLADHYLQRGTLRPWEPVAFAFHLDEGIYVYDNGWIAVAKLTGEFTVARVFVP